MSQSPLVKNLFVTSSVLPDPSASAYVVFLPVPLKNVYRVDLLSASYSAASPVKTLYLDVEELRSPVQNMTATANVYASASPMSSAFAALTGVSSGSFTVGQNHTVIVTYPNPIQRVDRLTVKWTDSTGAPLTFNGESAFLLRVYSQRK